MASIVHVRLSHPPKQSSCIHCMLFCPQCSTQTSLRAAALTTASRTTARARATWRGRGRHTAVPRRGGGEARRRQVSRTPPPAAACFRHAALRIMHCCRFPLSRQLLRSMHQHRTLLRGARLSPATQGNLWPLPVLALHAAPAWRRCTTTCRHHHRHHFRVRRHRTCVSRRRLTSVHRRRLTGASVASRRPHPQRHRRGRSGHCRSRPDRRDRDGNGQEVPFGSVSPHPMIAKQRASDR